MMSDLHEETFLQNYASTNRLRHTSRSASADLSAAKRRAKEAGVDLPIMDMARKFAELSPVEFTAKINKFFDYISWLQLHGSGSLSRIQAPDLTKDSNDADHFAEGRLAALDGLGMDACPWDITQGAGQHWVEGWHDGVRASTERAVVENVELIKSGIKPLEDDTAIEPAVEGDNPPPEDTPAFLTKPETKAKAETKAKPKPAKAKPKPARKPRRSLVEAVKELAESRAEPPPPPVDEPAEVIEETPPPPPEEAQVKEQPKKVDIDAILARHAKPRQQDAA